MTWLADIERIARTGQMRPVPNGTLTPSGRPSKTTVDFTTARVLLNLRNALNEANRAKLEAMPLVKAVDIAWGAHRKARSR